MIIAVLANDGQWEALAIAGFNPNFLRVKVGEIFSVVADAFLVLDEEAGFNFHLTTKPVLINIVSSTLSEMNAPANVVRINGWNSFIAQSSWEIAGQVTEPIKEIITMMNKESTIVADQEGFVSARIISMIINEAYFAVGENISTKNEIDIAMKLGTNYPYGPFEWAALIGVNKICALLQKLSKGNKRYLPAPLLKEEATIWG